MEKLTTAQRCRIHAEKMNDEGWYVTANVLWTAANQLEELEQRIEAERQAHEATIQHCDKMLNQ